MMRAHQQDDCNALRVVEAAVVAVAKAGAAGSEGDEGDDVGPGRNRAIRTRPRRDLIPSLLESHLSSQPPTSHTKTLHSCVAPNSKSPQGSKGLKGWAQSRLCSSLIPTVLESNTGAAMLRTAIGSHGAAALSPYNKTSSFSRISGSPSLHSCVLLILLACL